MVFGRIYDLEPQPQFFNVKQFKEEGFSRYKKAKRGVRRGVVLFVDPPEIKYKEVRRRPFSGSGGINAKVRANPQMANFYQLNKLALSQMNKKVIERKQNEMDPLKMAELALLAKINENLEKKETAVSIAQTEPPEDNPEMVDEIIQAQSDLGNIEEENKVLQEQLKQTRQQLNTLTKEKKAVEEDEARDIKVMEQFETDKFNEIARFNEEIINRNNQFVENRMAVFKVPPPPTFRPSAPARPQEPLERIGAVIEPQPQEPEPEYEPEKGSVAEKIARIEGRAEEEEEVEIESAEVPKLEQLMTPEQFERIREKEREIAGVGGGGIGRRKLTEAQKDLKKAKMGFTKTRNKLIQLERGYKDFKNIEEFKKQLTQARTNLTKMENKRKGKRGVRPQPLITASMSVSNLEERIKELKKVGKKYESQKQDLTQKLDFYRTEVLKADEARDDEVQKLALRD